MARAANTEYHHHREPSQVFSSAALYRRYIARQSSPTTWAPPHLLAYTLMLFFSLDFALLATGQRTLYLHHDPLLFYFRRHVISHSVVLFFAPLFLAMFAYVDYTVALQDNRPLVPVAANLLLDNGAHFRLAMGTRQNVRSIKQSISFFRTYYHLWTGALQVGFTRRLAYLPTLTPQTRVRLALFQLESLVSRLVDFFVGFFLLAISVAVLVMLITEPTFSTTWLTAISTSLYLTIDLYLIAGVYLNTTILFVFAFRLTFLICLLIFWHGDDINRALSYQVEATCRRTSHDQRRLAEALAHYRAEHAKLLKVLLTTNRHLVSPLLFCITVPNIASNIYILSLAFFTALNIFTQGTFLLAILMQTFLLPMFKYLPKPVKMLYRNQSTLYRAQMALRGPSLVRDKIKLLYTYELVNCEAKCWFTFGTVSPISDMWVFQSLLLYTSYLMFSFKMFY